MTKIVSRGNGNIVTSVALGNGPGFTGPWGRAGPVYSSGNKPLSRNTEARSSIGTARHEQILSHL